MKTMAGVVENGIIRLPSKARVRNGSRVVMMILGRKRRKHVAPPDPRIEAEDAQFVQACRRSISEAMRIEER